MVDGKLKLYTPFYSTLSNDLFELTVIMLSLCLKCFLAFVAICNSLADVGFQRKVWDKKLQFILTGEICSAPESSESLWDIG